MMQNIIARQNKKNTPTNGTESDDSGMDSATRSMKTVTASINVTATPNLSPDPAGKINVMVVNKVMSTIGKMRLNT